MVNFYWSHGQRVEETKMDPMMTKEMEIDDQTLARERRNS
jgi:hypothetical protein